MNIKAIILPMIGTLGLVTGVAHAVTPAFQTPVTDHDYYENAKPSSETFELGRMLFFDKILSGNKNISCATCHHPSFASADGVALPLGEGAKGLGTDRRTGSTIYESVAGRVPRNSPALFNVGAREFERLFHDGRVETDPNGYFEGGFVTPAKWKLPKGLENTLAAQAMFPVTSAGEMAGQKGENPIADAVSLNNAAGKNGVWELLAKRLQDVPAYVEMFENAFPEQVAAADDISYVLAANAIAAFETVAFRSDNSKFDEYLRGAEQVLDSTQRRGMALFYGEAGCGTCHSGKFQTDHEFHAISMPQIGPGKNDGNDASYATASGISAVVEDFGRGRVTAREHDNYKFRTPSLRNVADTGPWGHAGAYDNLEAVIRHHLDPVVALNRYDPASANLVDLGEVVELTASGSRFSQGWLSDSRSDGFALRDTWVQATPHLRENIARANELQPLNLSDQDVADLQSFLHALSDNSAKRMRTFIPAQVPSGLPVDD